MITRYSCFFQTRLLVQKSKSNMLHAAIIYVLHIRSFGFVTVSSTSIWGTSAAALRQEASTQPALAAPAGDGAKAVAEQTRVWKWSNLDDLIQAGIGDSPQ